MISWISYLKNALARKFPAGVKLIEKFSQSFHKFYFTRFEQEVMLDIQHYLLDHTLHFPKASFDSKETGYRMSRLLSAGIKENLCYGNLEADEERMIRAAKAATGNSWKTMLITGL